MILFSIHELGRATWNHDMAVVQRSPDFSCSQRWSLRLFLISVGFSSTLLLDTTFFFSTRQLLACKVSSAIKHSTLEYFVSSDSV